MHKNFHIQNFIDFDNASEQDLQAFYDGKLDQFIDDDGTLNIPCGIEIIDDQIDNYQNKNQIIKIIVPDSVIILGYRSFAECINLQSVDLPNSLIYLAQDTFFQCQSIQSVILPDSIKMLGASTFYNCTSLTYVKLPNQIQILRATFQKCSNLKTVVIPSSVEYIYYSCFRESGLQDIIIPNSIKYIDQFVFSNCSSLNSVIILNENAEINYQAFSDSIYFDDEQLLNSSGFIINENYQECNENYSYIYNLNTPDICIRNDYVYAYYINDEERKISVSYCPDEKPYLLTIDTPYQCIESCEQYTENECQLQDKQNKVFSLNSKNIEDYIEGDEQEILRVPEGILIFGDGEGLLKENQRNIKKIILPKSLQIVSTWSILTSECMYSEQLCVNIIEEIQFQSDIKMIDIQAFIVSYNLKKVTGLQNLKRINMGTFASCKNLEYIDTTNKLTYIGSTAFNSCGKLQMIDISNVKYIGKNAFYNCSSITHVDIPPITELFEEIFDSCSNLQSVNIPDEVIEIYSKVFSNCEKLQCVSIQNENCTIDSSAFSNTPFETSYESLKDPNKRCFIDGYGYCNDTTTSYPYQAYYYDNLICTTESNVKYFYTQNNIKIRVSSCPDTYPYQLSNTQPIECVENCNNLYIQEQFCVNECDEEHDFIQNGECVISCTIDQYPYIQVNECVNNCSEQYPLIQENICVSECSEKYQQQDNECILSQYYQDIETFEQSNLQQLIDDNGTLSIPSGITTISQEIQQYQNKSQITSIILPTSVTTIQQQAFSNCNNLQSIELSQNIQFLGNQAFSNCTNLEIVNISNNIQQLSTSIQILQDTLIEYGEYIFENCINLKNITLPQNLQGIQKGTFINCSSLEYIQLPNNIRYINDQAFQGCSKLKMINIPESVEQIGEYAFENCSSLECVSIQNIECNISNNAFQDSPVDGKYNIGEELCSEVNDGNEDDNGDGSNIGMIIGIVVGVVVVICVIVVVSVCVCKKKYKEKNSVNTVEMR